MSSMVLNEDEYDVQTINIIMDPFQYPDVNDVDWVHFVEEAKFKVSTIMDINYTHAFVIYPFTQPPLGINLLKRNSREILKIFQTHSTFINDPLVFNRFVVQFYLMKTSSDIMYDQTNRFDSRNVDTPLFAVTYPPVGMDGIIYLNETYEQMRAANNQLFQVYRIGEFLTAHVMEEKPLDLTQFFQINQYPARLLASNLTSSFEIPITGTSFDFYSIYGYTKDIWTQSSVATEFQMSEIQFNYDKYADNGDPGEFASSPAFISYPDVNNTGQNTQRLICIHYEYAPNDYIESDTSFGRYPRMKDQTPVCTHVQKMANGDKLKGISLWPNLYITDPYVGGSETHLVFFTELFPRSVTINSYNLFNCDETALFQSLYYDDTGKYGRFIADQLQVNSDDSLIEYKFPFLKKSLVRYKFAAIPNAEGTYDYHITSTYQATAYPKDCDIGGGAVEDLSYTLCDSDGSRYRTHESMTRGPYYEVSDFVELQQAFDIYRLSDQSIFPMSDANEIDIEGISIVPIHPDKYSDFVKLRVEILNYSVITKDTLLVTDRTVSISVISAKPYMEPLGIRNPSTETIIYIGSSLIDCSSWFTKPYSPGGDNSFEFSFLILTNALDNVGPVGTMNFFEVDFGDMNDIPVQNPKAVRLMDEIKYEVITSINVDEKTSYMTVKVTLTRTLETDRIGMCLILTLKPPNGKVFDLTKLSELQVTLVDLTTIAALEDDVFAIRQQQVFYLDTPISQYIKLFGFLKTYEYLSIARVFIEFKWNIGAHIENYENFNYLKVWYSVSMDLAKAKNAMVLTDGVAPNYNIPQQYTCVYIKNGDMYYSPVFPLVKTGILTFLIALDYTIIVNDSTNLFDDSSLTRYVALCLI